MSSEFLSDFLKGYPKSRWPQLRDQHKKFESSLPKGDGRVHNASAFRQYLVDPASAKIQKKVGNIPPPPDDDTKMPSLSKFEVTPEKAEEFRRRAIRQQQVNRVSSDVRDKQMELLQDEMVDDILEAADLAAEATIVELFRARGLDPRMTEEILQQQDKYIEEGKLHEDIRIALAREMQQGILKNAEKNNIDVETLEEAVPAVEAMLSDELTLRSMAMFDMIAENLKVEQNPYDRQMVVWNPEAQFQPQQPVVQYQPPPNQPPYMPQQYNQPSPYMPQPYYQPPPNQPYYQPSPQEQQFRQQFPGQEYPPPVVGRPTRRPAPQVDEFGEDVVSPEPGFVQGITTSTTQAVGGVVTEVGSELTGVLADKAAEQSRKAAAAAAKKGSAAAKSAFKSALSSLGKKNDSRKANKKARKAAKNIEATTVVDRHASADALSAATGLSKAAPAAASSTAKNLALSNLGAAGLKVRRPRRGEVAAVRLEMYEQGQMQSNPSMKEQEWIQEGMGDQLKASATKNAKQNANTLQSYWISGEDNENGGVLDRAGGTVDSFITDGNLDDWTDKGLEQGSATIFNVGNIAIDGTKAITDGIAWLVALVAAKPYIPRKASFKHALKQTMEDPEFYATAIGKKREFDNGFMAFKGPNPKMMAAKAMFDQEQHSMSGTMLESLALHSSPIGLSFSLGSAWSGIKRVSGWSDKETPPERAIAYGLGQMVAGIARGDIDGTINIDGVQYVDPASMRVLSDVVSTFIFEQLGPMQDPFDRIGILWAMLKMNIVIIEEVQGLRAKKGEDSTPFVEMGTHMLSLMAVTAAAVMDSTSDAAEYGEKLSRVIGGIQRQQQQESQQEYQEAVAFVTDAVAEDVYNDDLNSIDAKVPEDLRQLHKKVMAIKTPIWNDKKMKSVKLQTGHKTTRTAMLIGDMKSDEFENEAIAITRGGIGTVAGATAGATVGSLSGATVGSVVGYVLAGPVYGTALLPITAGIGGAVGAAVGGVGGGAGAGIYTTDYVLRQFEEGKIDPDELRKNILSDKITMNNIEPLLQRIASHYIVMSATEKNEEGDTFANASKIILYTINGADFSGTDPTENLSLRALIMFCGYLSRAIMLRAAQNNGGKSMSFALASALVSELVTTSVGTDKIDMIKERLKKIPAESDVGRAMGADGFENIKAVTARVGEACGQKTYVVGPVKDHLFDKTHRPIGNAQDRVLRMSTDKKHLVSLKGHKYPVNGNKIEIKPGQPLYKGHRNMHVKTAKEPDYKGKSSTVFVMNLNPLN